MKCWHNIDSSLKIVKLKFWINILYSLETMQFSTLEILPIFGSCFIITFDWMENFKFWLFHRKDLVQIYQNQTFFSILKYNFLSIKYVFRPKKMIIYIFFVAVSFQMTSKVQRFLNSDDSIGEISTISIRNSPNLFETLIFWPMKINFNVKISDLC